MPEARETQETRGSDKVTSDNEVDQDEEKLIPRASEDNQWVTATTRYGRSSRLLERYQQELNMAGMASKNYNALLCEEEEDEERKLNWPVWVQD